MPPTPPSLRAGRFIAGAVIATALTVGGSHLLLQSELSGAAARQDHRVGIVSLNGLIELVGRAGGEPEKVRHAVAAWQPLATQVSALRVLLFSGISLEASTAPGDVGERSAPRKLTREEKPFFDQGQRLRAAVETNRDEGSARKDEIEVERRGDGSIAFAGPLSLGPDVVGLVELVGASRTAPARASVPLAFGFGLGVCVAVTLLALALARRGRAADRWIVAGVGALAVAVGVFAHGNYAQGAIDEARATVTAAISAHARAQGQHVATVAAADGLSAARLTPGAWDSDLRRQSVGELQPNGDVMAAAAAPSEISRAVSALALLAVVVFLLVGFGAFHWLWRTAVENRVAYAYIAPAMVGMALLVFFPFLYGITLSFTGSSLYNANKGLTEILVGLQNYREILGDFNVVTKSAEGGTLINYANFYWTLLFTIIWTVSNVTIGVTLGLALALVLNIKNLAFRPIYRVLLILPWAVPNYITALIWKGMFHRQFGVVNHLITLAGGQPLSWFDAPLTSFATALATNGWLSFPFMMVVSLGALQSIPDELYEAAEVDGASRLQQFFAITLPALRPALVPAIILSVVWTFNMFNIIYLVTGGEPGGATEILVTQAYKHAFERYRYGYAAAYSTVIFLILLAYGVFQNRVSRATEA